MKITLLIFISIFLINCAVQPYQPPKSGDVAYLKVPKSTKKYSLIGGFSGQNVSVGVLDKDGCIGFRKTKPVKETSLDENGQLIVPADIPIVLTASSNFGNNVCGLVSTATLEKDRSYNFTFMRTLKSCGIALTRLEADGSLTPVTVERLKDKFIKFCREQTD